MERRQAARASGSRIAGGAFVRNDPEGSGLILYLDSSSLVKLYVDEAYSSQILAAVGSAEVVATSPVALPETTSALARRTRSGDLSPHQLELVRQALAQDWPTFLLQPVSEQKAGDLAARHCLRGFDAIHLAAASDLAAILGPSDLCFSSFDRKLLEAARLEGFRILEPDGETLL